MDYTPFLKMLKKQYGTIAIEVRPSASGGLKLVKAWYHRKNDPKECREQVALPRKHWKKLAECGAFLTV